MIDGHGDDIYGKTVVSNFSSNIYNRSDTSALDAYLCGQVASIHSYPEPDAASFVRLLAEWHNIQPSHILATNGATEAIYLIAQVFEGKTSTILIPTFSEYEDACRVNNHNLKFIYSLSEFAGDSDLIWLCNPNNPTGKALDITVLKETIENHPRTLFIIDQSYAFFTLKETLQTAGAAVYPNVILLLSMTKRYAIPGLRLGYITGNSHIIGQIRKYCMPWAVNQLAIEAGKYLIEHDSELNIWCYLHETKRLATELNKIEGLTAWAEDTNFFLCRLADRTGKDLKAYLLEEHGILIRDAANFRGLDEHYFRVATQLPNENNNLTEAIKAWI